MRGPQYERGELIARGGSGAVYRGMHNGREVSIKVVKAYDVCELERETRILASIPAHPNIVGLVDQRIVDDELHLIREWVDGCNLVSLVGSQVPPTIAIHIVRSVLRGLAEAVHPTAIVHRDLSPANVLISRQGVVKITDFGISAHLASMPIAGEIFAGTLAYASPEQAAAKPCDLRSDLFSLGLIFYELLAAIGLIAGQRARFAAR